ncbi:hypothetical protein [Klenkia brasiliensis]|uniref:Uncharacterized protein n=1 Tax=Klenkia brasiliensis TaxID=333142 RepID=A0A1G7ZSD2_9ACTN|nr:hypothetical protein [Klenkia brasiliensis]SDH11612.1 hypothetical protein SAMN05660324_4346 [Klenkia brasiliensis]
MTTTTSLLAGICPATAPARWQAGCTHVHAVETHRGADELDGGPELAVCGAVVAVGSAPWDPSAADACPACGG